MTEKRHSLLERQLRKKLVQQPEGADWESFLNAVNDSYHHFDAEQELLNRSIELSTQELMSKNGELKQKNEALDSFVYRVAHDLRSPISNIHAMLAMLAELIDLEGQPPLVGKILENLDTSAKNLNIRISDLLDMTKLERNQNIPAERLHFAEMAEEILFNLSSKIEANNADVQFDFEAYPEITFARENLKSVMGNLIENAIKYRDFARSPEIKIASAPGEEGFGCLTISDNGLGIDLEKAGDRLFGLFNRMHSHVEGSGVGLYLVKKIVEQNGGRVVITSTPGLGTTFKLYLRDDIAAT
jgi:signal transduction histidine kinase